MAKKVSDDFDRQFDEATKRGGERLKLEPRADAVTYDAKSNRIRIELSNGCMFMFPPDVAQGLREASASELADVEIFGGGLDLNWRSLDAQFSVTGLLAGIFGTKAWMAEMGRKGGSAATEAKQAASRANGAKGGRPRKKIA